MYLLLLALLPLGMMAQDDDGIGPFTTPVHAWLWPLSDLCVDSVKQSKDRRWKGYRVLGYEHAAFGVLFTFVGTICVFCITIHWRMRWCISSN